MNMANKRQEEKKQPLKHPTQTLSRREEKRNSFARGIGNKLPPSGWPDQLPRKTDIQQRRSISVEVTGGQ